ncbi:putative glucan endo-1,3-beta-D-glucosidase [Helianthus anomalus]
MATPPHLLLLTLFLSLLYITSSTGTIGINYGRIANNLPNPTQVIQLLNTNGIARIKLFDTDPTVLNALSNSTISVM